METMRYGSPIGSLWLAGKDGALVGLWMEGQKYFPETLREEKGEGADRTILFQAQEWLDRYFKGERPSIGELALAPVGSGFCRKVWKVLCQIPYGEVTTYGEIARRIAAQSGLKKVSARAVGGAVGHNPISIIIPCHRVVGADGSLTGYAGGIHKKSWLLSHEGSMREGCLQIVHQGGR